MENSFTYTLNIILAVLRILSFSYTHREEVTKLCKEAEREAGKDFAEVKALIDRVVSLSIESRGTAAPSFRSEPEPSSRAAVRYEPLPSFEPGREGESGLYDAEEEDVADGLVADGSRGSQSGPPPYVPGREDTENGIPLGRYGKDQEFPGLR